MSVIRVILLLHASVTVSNSQTIGIDILDAHDPGGPSPAGALVIDVSLDIPETSEVTIGAIVGQTFNGARLVYRLDDPNSVFTPPGTSHPFVSFACFGYERNEPARFEPLGTPMEPSAWAGGPYDGDVNLFLDQAINTLFGPSPIPNPSFGRDGFFLRLAFDISSVSIPGADNAANYRIFTPGEEPAGFLPVFVSAPQVYLSLPGTAFAIRHGSGEEQAGRDWGVYVPEASIGLIWLTGIVLVSRFRRSRVAPRRGAATLAFICGLASVAKAQPIIGDQQRIDIGGGAYDTNETAVACAELNPMVAVAAWNDAWSDTFDGQPLNLGLDVGATTDGGATWQEYPLSGLPSCLGDPMATADPQTGTLWVGGMASGCAQFIWVAKWNGAGFDTAVNVTGTITSADKPFMAAGRIPGVPGSTRLYVVYYDSGPQYLKWSDAFGAAGSWQGPVALPQTPNGVNPDGPLPRVGPNGEVYIVANDVHGYGIWLYRWIWQPGQPTTPQFGAPLSVATRLDAWDFSITNPRFPGLFRVPARSYLAVDPMDGTLYAVWFDTTRRLCWAPPGGGGGCLEEYDVDIYLSKSTSQGNAGTWTTPRIVNAADMPPYDQFFPWIEVDSSHRLHMVFYDTLGTPHSDADGQANLRARYSYSSNGGNTWSEITLAPRWNGSPTTWPDVSVPPGPPFIGDYNGLAVTTTRVYPVYMATYGPQQPQPPTGNHNIYSNVITWP